MYPALEEAYRDGRLGAIGVSNFNAARHAAFLRSCTVIPAVNQVEAMCSSSSGSFLKT